MPDLAEILFALVVLILIFGAQLLPDLGSAIDRICQRKNRKRRDSTRSHGS